MSFFTESLKNLIDIVRNFIVAYKAGEDHVYLGSYYYEFTRKMPVIQVSSVSYLILLVVLFLFLCITPNVFRPYLYLIASIFFLYTNGIDCLILIGIEAAFGYVAGMLLRKNKNKMLFWISIAVPIVMLCFFKYVYHDMPLGISFYSFKIISYLADIYKSKYEAEKKTFAFASYVLFFPAINAGPIHRYEDYVDELKKDGVASSGKVVGGLFQLFAGLFEKKVLCDYVAEIVGRIDANLELGGMNILFGLILYSFQIYLDFDSYSNIAIGSARFLGVDLKENFKTPYLSVNLKDFWSGWHISLSNWFRDYIYISLGGNRKGNIRKYLNILAVFVVSGLWHGNTMSFLLWGVLHGFFRVLEDVLESHIDRDKINKVLLFIIDVFRMILNFILVTFLWVFFKQDSFDKVKQIFTRLFTASAFSYESIGLTINEFKWLLVVLLIVFVCDLIRKFVDVKKLTEKFYIWPIELILTVVMIVVYLVFGVYGGSFEASDFIYQWF